jgi:prepilin-type N-terminal cleavage/methylation domain-containing protein
MHRIRAGFTIVELIVVLALLGILVALVDTGFRDYQRHQEYQVFVTDVKNGLNEARTKTLGSVNGNTYGAYIGTSTLEFFSGTTPTVGNAANNIIYFPPSMHATSTLSDDNWYIYFNRLTGIGSATGTITIVDETTGASSTLSITSTGTIE